MARTKDLHAELISVAPAASGGGGTVTSVHVTQPLTGGGPGPVVNIGITQFDQAHTGYVPSPGVADDSKVLLSDGWHDKTVGEFVLLQAATPGITQTGNFNVGGTGIAGTLLVGGFSPDFARIGVNADGNTDSYGIEVITVNGAAGIQITAGAAAFGINIASDTNNAIVAASNSATTAVFGSAQAANALPTVIIAQNAAGTANLLEFRDGNNNAIGQFNPIGARLGLGNLPGLPDTMLHLFGGNTFTGSAAIIVQNDSQTDLSNVSKLCFADTNTAATLSNACIVFQPQAGAAGRLAFFVGGTDNDTPGAFDTISMTGADGVTYVNFPGLGGSQGSFVFQVGGAAYFDGQVKANSGILMGGVLNMNASNIDMGGGNIVNGGSLTFTSNYAIDGAGAVTGSGSDWDVNFGALNNVHGINTDGSGTSNFGWDVTVATKLAVGSATIGSHALDVTGDAAADKFIFPTGAAGTSGQSALFGGTITVSTTAIGAASFVTAMYRGGAGANAGFLRIDNIVAGVSFDIISSNALDANTVDWFFVN